MIPPALTIQAGTLWVSNESSFFSGHGGPQGYEPYFGQFADIVSSKGLDAEAFDDQLWNVDAGDEVVFVIAVQNRSPAPVYNVKMRDLVPAGFRVPAEGNQLSVMDGGGYPLDYTGDLFDIGTGLQLTAPIPAYDPDSGDNVVLLTFSLQTTAALSAPLARMVNTAQIMAYSASPTGPNLNATPIAASTPVITGSVTVASTDGQNIVSLASGQRASFDITLTLAEGSISDLRIDEIFPRSGGSWLHLLSTEIVRVGAHLQTSSPPTVAPDGSVSFHDVTNSPDNVTDAADQIVIRVAVESAGTAAGQGFLQTQVSAVDPNTTGGRWSTSVSNVLALEAPNARPSIAAIRAGQNATNTMQIRPFAGIVLADADVGQIEKLTVHLSDPLMGVLSGNGLSVTPGGDYVLTGRIDQVQDDLRNLIFKTGPGHTGLELMTLTLDDGAGGITTDSGTSVLVSAAVPAAAAIQHFPLSLTDSVLTATADGSQTVAQIETYQGPVSYLQSQFIYDGTAPLAIVAQTPNVFIKNVAGSTAVQLLSGQNVVDAGHGSNFIIGGTGNDVFFLDGRSLQETWDTIVNFHPGDIATLWGFKDGVSRYWWDDNAGAGAYTGRTLRADLTGNGHIDASLTFAGTTAAGTARYALTTGSIAGNDYMTIFSL